MISENATIRFLSGSRLIAFAVGISLVVVFIATSWLSIATTLELKRSVAESGDLLDQLKGRRSRGAASRPGEPVRKGSPFLEGPTVTVAGASLLQRVAGAITQVGGNIQSSQVNVQGVQSKDGFVGLLISCEVEQPALQNLIYDIESGMPFLFIDQLDVQMPEAASSNQTAPARMRVMLGVSGQWQPSK